MRVRAATKTELRQEIAELRTVGAQMANFCFNLGQECSSLRRLGNESWADTMRDMQRQWDAIKRREASTVAAALVRRARGEEPTE